MLILKNSIVLAALVCFNNYNNLGAKLARIVTENPRQERELLYQSLSNLVDQKRDLINNLNEMKLIVDNNDVLKIPKKEDLKIVFEKLAGPLDAIDKQINDVRESIEWCSLQLNEPRVTAEPIINILQKLDENNFLEELSNFFGGGQIKDLKENLAQLMEKELALKESLKPLLINAHEDLDYTKEILISYMSFKTDCLLFLFDFPTYFFTEIFVKNFPKINELLSKEAFENQNTIRIFRHVLKEDNPTLNRLNITSSLIKDIARANRITLDNVSLGAKCNLKAFEGELEYLLKIHQVKIDHEKNALKRLLDATEKLDEAKNWNKKANKRIAKDIVFIFCSAAVCYTTNPALATLGGVGMAFCWIQDYTSCDLRSVGLGAMIIAGLVCKLKSFKSRKKNIIAKEESDSKPEKEDENGTLCNEGQNGSIDLKDEDLKQE